MHSRVLWLALLPISLRSAAASDAEIVDAAAEEELLSMSTQLLQTRIGPGQPVSVLRGEPWLLYPAGEAPRGVRTVGPEVTLPANNSISDPIMQTCGGDPEDLKRAIRAGTLVFDAHWTWNVSTPTLIPFIVDPADPRHTDIAVVIAPGGGFRFLAADMEGTDIAAWFNSQGISAFVLKYRVSTLETDMLTSFDDAQRAISLVRRHAEEYGLARQRIGFIGFSAGGALATMMALSTQRAYNPVDETDNVSSRPAFVLSIYPFIPAPIARLAALAARGAPHMFMAISDDDPCCKAVNAAGLYEELRRNGGARNELHVYNNGGHGWGRCSMRPPLRSKGSLTACTWPLAARKWMEAILETRLPHPYAR